MSIIDVTPEHLKIAIDKPVGFVFERGSQLTLLSKVRVGYLRKRLSLRPTRQETEKLLEENNTNFKQQFYMGGPSPMIVEIEKMMLNIGVDKN